MAQLLAGKGFRSKDSLVTKSAAKGGNVEVLKFLLSLDCPMAEDVCIKIGRASCRERVCYSV